MRFGSRSTQWRGQGVCSGGVVAGVWGQSPQRGSGAEPLVRGLGGEAPLKLKRFKPSEDRGTDQFATLLSIL